MSMQSIIESATSLQANSTKVEIIAMARALGWKGDHARAPILQLALFVATKLASGERAEDLPVPREDNSRPDGGQGGNGQGEQPQGGNGKGDQPQGDQPQGQGDQPQGGNGQGEQPQGDQPQGDQPQGDQPQGDQPQGEQPQGDNGRPPEGQQESEKAQGDQPQGDQPKEAAKPDHSKPPRWNPDTEQFEYEAMKPQGEQPQGEQPQGEQPQGEQPEGEQPEGEQPEGEQPEGEQPEAADHSNEYRQLLKASGIDRPHIMLEKAWRICSKAGLNLMLVGPASTGKTMLSQQLAQLLRVPFSSISCTMGMSESQLTGWLLPVGAGGAFDYVPSPFVTCLQQPSVFLLDELDAADPNVLMVLNSVLSNGFITIPHKLKDPTIVKHDVARIIAGVNTCGNGADDVYSARAALDGSTVDRFYIMAVDYDPAYEKSLFTMPNAKKKTRSAPWAPSKVAVDQTMLDQLQEWFFTLRKGVARAKLNKIVSSRMAQRAVASVLAGIPVDEVKNDLLLGWSDDEKMRAQGGAR